MKQVFFIIVLLLAVLAGYLYFYEPQTLDRILGKSPVAKPIADQGKGTISKPKTTPRNPNPDRPIGTVPPQATLTLPEDGMRYYLDGKPVSGPEVKAPSGTAVLVGYRDGQYRNELIRLKNGETNHPQGPVKTVQVASDWDTFQGGSHRTGHLDATDRQRLEVVWKSQLGQKVQSSPILYNGKAYFASAKHLLNAVDLQTGKLLWSQGSVGSSVTPIINSQFGFAGDNLGEFTGFRLKDGKPKGTARLDSYAISLGLVSQEAFLAVTRSNTVYSIQTRKGVFGRLPLDVNWDLEVAELRGSQAAPVIAKNRIIFQTEGHGLVALALNDGSRAWPKTSIVASEAIQVDAQSFVRDDVFLTPTPAAGDELVFGMNETNLVALDIATGDERWRAPLEMRPCSSITLAFDMVIFGAGDGTIRAHSALDGREIYVAQVGQKPVFASPIVFADKLLVATGEGAVKLLDCFSGEPLVEDESLAPTGIDATPAVSESGILVINRRGDMVLYR